MIELHRGSRIATRYVLAVAWVLLAGALAQELPAAPAATPPPTGPRARSGVPSIESLILPDGRIDLGALQRSGYQGALDPGRLALRLDPQAGPVPRSAGDPIGTWSNRYTLNSTDCTVSALGEFEGDLIVAGRFDRIGDIEARNIARWTGTQWLPIGDGVDVGVRALAVYRGELIAGGENLLQSWDGQAWRPLGQEIGGSVQALEVYQDELVLGGTFTSIDGITASNIAAWNGESFRPYGAGVSGVSGGGVFDLLVLPFGPSGILIVGGAFIEAGGKPAPSLAIWGGESWTPLPSGEIQFITAMTVFEQSLLVGGFGANLQSLVESVEAEFRAPFGSDLDTGFSAPRTFAVHRGELYVGGFRFDDRQTVQPLLRRWDGEVWRPAEIGLGNRKQATGGGEFVAALLVFQDRLLAGGLFGLGVAEYDGTAWNTLSGPGLGLDGPVTALAPYRAALAAAGSFAHAGTTRTGGIALLEDGAWRSIADSVREGAFPGFVRAMVEYRGDLIVAGQFTRIDSIPVVNIARFDGRAWGPVGEAFFDDEIAALTVSGSQLIAGGAFTTPAPGVAAFDASNWTGLGNGIPGPVRALTVQGGILAIGGSFRGAGGLNVARWDGTQFLSTPVVGGDVAALTVFAGRIVAGGSFLDGQNSRAIRLGDAGWEPISVGLSYDVIALAAYKSTMIAGMQTFGEGDFEPCIRRWNGASWEPMGSGVVLDCDPQSTRVPALAVHAGGLFAGGEFSLAGDNASYSLGEWRERIEPVSEFVVESAGESNILRWRNPASVDFAGVEVRVDTLAPILARTDGQPVPNGAQGIFQGVPAAVDSFVHAGLRSGQPYWYGIFAFDTAGGFSDALADSGTPLDTQPPGIATAFFATPSDTAVTLTWTAPPDADTRGVFIAYAVGNPPPQSGLIFRPIENSNDGRFPCTAAQADSFVHLGRRNGERYTYRLNAYDEMDNLGPPRGAVAIPADVNAPLPLASFALERGDSELRLGWDFVPGDDVQGVLVRFDTLTAPADTLSGQPVPNGRSGSFTTEELGFTHRPLRNGTVYQYSAFTFDEAGNLSLPVSVSGSPADSIAPDEVFGFTALAADTTVTLRFTTPEDTDVAGVRIVFSDAPFQDLSLASPFPNGNDGRFPARLLQEFTVPHTPLENGTTYFYAVQAYDEADNRSFPLFANATPRDSLAPAGVTTFTAAPGDTTVMLAWTTPQDADVTSVRIVFGLQPFGQDPSGGQPVPNGADGHFTAAPGSPRTFEHQPLPNGTTHYYVIRVLDEANNESFPGFAQAIPRDTLAPAALATFTAEPLDTQVRLSWQNPTTLDYQGVVIWYDTTAAPNPDTAIPVENGNQGRFSRDVQSFLHPNRTNGVRYSYVARTFDEVPNFGSVSRAQATPQDVTPPGLVAALAGTSEDSVLALTWTNPSDEDYVGAVVRYAVEGFPASPTGGRPFPRNRAGRFIGTSRGSTAARGGGLVNGVTYYFSVFSFDERDNFSDAQQLTVRFEDGRVQSVRVPPIQAATYALWSAPLELRSAEDGAARRMSDIFGPVLGPMGSSRWRGLGLEADTLRIDPPVVPGRGYWISTLVPLPPEFEVTGAPPAAPSVSLRAGWNIVSSPSSEPIPPSQLRVQFDESSLTLADALAQVEPILLEVGLDWLDVSGDLENNGEFSDRSLIEVPLPSGSGFLIRAYQDFDLCFYCGLDGPGFAPEKRAARRAATPDWFIDLAVTSDGQTNDDVRVGASRLARDGWDSQDRPRPPLPGAALTLRVDHRDWGRYADLYSRSIAASETREHRWPLLVSGARDRITISWTHADSLPDSLQAYAVLPGGVAVPLRDRTSFDAPLEGDTFAFELVVRSGPFEGDFVEDGFSGLRPLRPNPSGRDGTTLLRYQVLSPSRPALRIFDVRGRLVKEFANIPGRVGAWSVPWDHTGSDGRRVAAGLYIVQLRLGDFASTEKIVLLH